MLTISSTIMMKRKPLWEARGDLLLKGKASDNANNRGNEREKTKKKGKDGKLFQAYQRTGALAPTPHGQAGREAV